MTTHNQALSLAMASNSAPSTRNSYPKLFNLDRQTIKYVGYIDVKNYARRPLFYKNNTPIIN